MDNKSFSLMMMDEFHYKIINQIKGYNYTKDLNILMIELKTQIHDLMTIFNEQYYSFQSVFLQLMCGFVDALFNIHGPNDKKLFWNMNSMEKVYCQTVTSGYTLLENFNEIVYKNQWLPLHIIYSYWLFFNAINISLEKNHINYLQNQLNIKQDKFIYTPIKKPSYHHILKINGLNYILLLGIIYLILTGNKILYWHWINDIL